MNKLSEFVRGYNTVLISNEKEFKKMVEAVKSLSDNGKPFGPIKSYKQLVSLAKLNGERRNENWLINNKGVLVEFDEKNMLNFGYTMESSKLWFEKEPYKFKEVFE